MKAFATAAAYNAARNYVVVDLDTTTGKSCIASSHATRAAANDELPVSNYYSNLRVMTRAQFARLA